MEEAVAPPLRAWGLDGGTRTHRSARQRPTSGQPGRAQAKRRANLEMVCACAHLPDSRSSWKTEHTQSTTVALAGTPCETVHSPGRRKRPQRGEQHVTVPDHGPLRVGDTSAHDGARSGYGLVPPGAKASVIDSSLLQGASGVTLIVMVPPLTVPLPVAVQSASPKNPRCSLRGAGCQRALPATWRSLRIDESCRRWRSGSD